MAVISQDRMEIPPTSASLVGNNTMPEPNMLTAVSIVSCPTVIFFATDIPLPLWIAVGSVSYSQGLRSRKKRPQDIEKTSYRALKAFCWPRRLDILTKINLFSGS
ncbi:hypothetical protein D3C87_1505060 [compost metagenome]